MAFNIAGSTYFTKVIDQIEKAQKKAIAKEEPRRYIGGSSLGQECERRIQYEIATENELGKQFGFQMADGAIQGHVDGILQDGPKIMEFPALVEFKSAKDSSYKKFVKKVIKVLILRGTGDTYT